jgi:UDP-glucose 4-epimerase
MATILVTGGAGFIGSHVARCLLQMGHAVVVLDDLSGGYEDNVPDGATLIVGGITDESLLKKVFSEYRFEYVYHLAAYAAEGLSHFIRAFNYTNNLIGSVHLINQSIIHDVKCFLFTSSIAVYGSNQLPMHEDLIPQPEDPYGVAKLAIEQDLKAAREMFGLDYVIFRPHNVYGENQNIGDRYRNVVGIFMNAIMHGQPMTIFGDGRQTRAFSYIGDVAPTIAQGAFCRGAYGQIFNIGADTPLGLNDLATAVANAMGVAPRVTYLPARKEVLHAYASHDKVHELFGRAPSTSLDEGLRRMASWVRKVGGRKSRFFERIEVDKNLPAHWRQ